MYSLSSKFENKGKLTRLRSSSTAERKPRADLASCQDLTPISTEYTTIIDGGSTSSPSDVIPDQQKREDPPAYSDRLYTSVEMDIKLRQLDHDLRHDMVSTFKEFEKVLRRTREELAEERFSRKEFEETTMMRINQLQAMVDEVAPRVGPQRRGSNSVRRHERVERQRQQWEALLWHD